LRRRRWWTKEDCARADLEACVDWVHAAAGLLAVAAGLRAIDSGATFGVYLASLIDWIAFVAGAVAVDWNTLDGGTRVLFIALLALGLYMIFRGARAGRRLADLPGAPSLGFVDDVGWARASRRAGRRPLTPRNLRTRAQARRLSAGAC
jgi:hypothetical protein